MSFILPHKGQYDNFSLNNNSGKLLDYWQNIGSITRITDTELNNEYDLFFYMYQMDAQNAIEAYHKNTLPNNLASDF